MVNIYTQQALDWSGPFSAQQQEEALVHLEQGNVIYFPDLSFKLQDDEVKFLTPAYSSPKSKNISYDLRLKKIQGSSCKAHETEQLKIFMERFSQQAQNLIKCLFPHYQNLKIARTSYRPVEILGRPSSYRKDDTRLHVDAFPSTPNQGDRILRVFTNINPYGQPRIWCLGEPFKNIVKRFVPHIQKPFIGSQILLKICGITKSRRSLYDHYMLHIHDRMKADEEYQASVPQTEFHFPPGSTWIVMTDSASHAVRKGQYLLEQTFYLPLNNMHNKALAPRCILEAFLGQSCA